MAQTKGVDISKWNGPFTRNKFKKLKQQGYSFVIIKMGGDNDGYYTDSQFESNYRLAKEAGLNVGAYYYLSGEFEPGRVVAHLLPHLLGKTFDMPIFLDIEESPLKAKESTTSNAIKILDALESLDFFVGIYASDVSGFANMLNLEKLAAYTLWTASWGNKKPSIVKTWAIWQNDVVMKGIPGFISGAIDVNICKRDFPTIIKGAHKNGY